MVIGRAGRSVGGLNAVGWSGALPGGCSGSWGAGALPRVAQPTSDILAAGATAGMGENAAVERMLKPDRANGDRRRPQPRSLRAILGATLSLLSENGYHDLTMEGVASRAGVGKQTIYRWWSSKGELVGDAIAAHLDLTPIPDLGDTRAELVRAVEGTIANYADTHLGVTVPALAADLARDPQLLSSFRRHFLQPRRELAAAVIFRAVARGELPPAIDPELLCDIWAGAVFYRVLVSGEPIERDLAERLVDVVLQGVAARECDAGHRLSLKIIQPL